jgi:hypothetical protein
MRSLIERAAQASGHYSDDEWDKLVSSEDPLDQCTVTNARAVASNILAMPELAAALRICEGNVEGLVIVRAMTRDELNQFGL